MKHRIKTIVLYALPYVLAFFGLLFRKKQLDNDSALFTPIQFEFITWINSVKKIYYDFFKNILIFNHHF